VATYYDLKIRCPACLANGKQSGPPSQWFHAKPGCNGKLQIGDDAQFRCVKCNEASHIKNWRYACESHQSDYRPVPAAHFASAIATAGQVTNIAGRQWLIDLLENMGDDW
jgi:hypothetical protein